MLRISNYLKLCYNLFYKVNYLLDFKYLLKY